MEGHTIGSMIKLEQVSKIYSAGGVISTGFSKVSLEFEIGEFVAITGESGSGKSTLLNVLSGLDSYEEGEMYVMGRATSGFTHEEMENYRKEYISTIFQTFNLVNSYTVYQNIELVLLMSGYKRSEIRKRVNEIINQVGLSKYRKTKTSKLSGGQKQRVAIGRALARETPVIVADEPTGNLDTKAAEEIIRLLHDISKNKLIIIVTHNYEQVEPYVTRKIRMHDGRVTEDKRLGREGKTEEIPSDKVKKARAGSLSFANMLRLSLRNTFNLPAKFLLLLGVFLFLSAGVAFSYSSTVNQQRVAARYGNNGFFRDTREERLLISKKDKGLITDEDYAAIEKMPNVAEVIPQDFFLDNVINMSGVNQEKEDDYIFLQVKVEPLANKKIKLEKGRMPGNDHEVILLVRNEDHSYVLDMVDRIMASDVKLQKTGSGMDLLGNNIRVVGYGFINEDQKSTGREIYFDGTLCASDPLLDEMTFKIFESYCVQEIEFADRIIDMDSINGPFPLRVSEKVPEGEIYIPEDMDYLTRKQASGMPLTIKNRSVYFDDSFDFTVGAVYKKSTLKRLLGLDNFDDISGSLFINPADHSRIFNKGNYQSSVMVKDARRRDGTAKAIEQKGFSVFKVSDGVVRLDETGDAFLKVVGIVVLALVVLVLFFISYFIIKLILKSRNIYYSTIRMLGAARKNCVSMLRTELIVVSGMAFFICAGFIELVKRGVIDIPYIKDMTDILAASDYVILYIVLLLMSVLLAGRYARHMFKKAALGAYREEV